jgi:Ca-activated chloride channel homolog
MKKKVYYGVVLALVTGIAATAYLTIGRVPMAEAGPADASAGRTQGELVVLDRGGNPAGACPLKNTDVNAEISGFLSRVTVTQTFENTFQEKIEAVYTFPLPANAAVDRMTMKVGDRVIRGTIKRKEEARAVYEAAKAEGHVASLLDQERPNIFTQSVANIMPGQSVEVSISYVDVLKYEDGAYQFVFPMVVGPRYIPGAPVGKKGGGWAPDTTKVPDASKITPPVTPPGTRTGHDVSIHVDLDAGVPIVNLASTLHDVDVRQKDGRNASIDLKDKATIPNKDFILTYEVAGGKIEDAILTHKQGDDGYFTMILQPPDRVVPADVTPKEIVFVLDTSGSMSGFPIETAKRTMKLAFDGLNPHDTFNLITFSGDTNILFPQPVPATKANLALAQRFLESRSGGGGTEMMKAIRAALDPSDAADHIRIACFMTDGYVGNDMEIISEIQKHPNARVFSMGIGNSVNRFLLDKMAEEGRGEVDYVTLDDDGEAAARRFHERVQNPLLTDVAIEWGGLPVKDIYPARIPDVFSAKPVVVCGRYTGQGAVTVRLRGNAAGRAVERDLVVTLPAVEARHDVLAKLWARTKIDDLMRQDYEGIQYGRAKPDVEEGITQIGLEHSLMTQFTSFVAVEEMTVTEGGQPRRIDVPVEMPEGVSYRGVFGADEESEQLAGGGGSGAGTIGRLSASNTSGPLMRRAPARPTAPPAPQPSRADKPKTYAPSSRMAVDTDAGYAGESAKPIDAKRQRLESKLDRALVTIVDALKQGSFTANAEQARFVKAGRAEVQVWLTTTSTNTIAKLQSLGFEVVLDPKNGKLLVGRIAIEKLEALAEVEGVRYVAPNRS